MTAQIISQTNDELTIQVKVSLKGSMLESEQSIAECVNQVGMLATGEALKQFDTDGSPIVMGDIKLTARCKNGKTYQTPYGAIHVDRHVYQSSKGGKIYVPLESGARIIQGASPRFAKTLSHKYSNLAAPSVIEDLSDNHERKISIAYLQKVTDYVGTIAQAKEELWDYDIPTLDKAISTIGISLDGAYVLTVNDGYREAMVGTITLYDSQGERQDTVYVAAAPEYGKASFFSRFEREISKMKKCYPKAQTIGIADGAKNNWAFLEAHTTRQILDYWHASEYLSEASYALFTHPGDNATREVWLEAQCHNLKHKQGAAGRILDALNHCSRKPLSKVLKEKLDAAISYFKNNIKGGRMKYHIHTKNNLPIGSGVVEAACKTLIKQRLGASGMRWKSEGIKMILSLRALVKTKGRWSQFWGKINFSGVPAVG
ncbi:hypothetical protein MNBD_DELTA03-40 [hydrothermal vent metagenome]|uniref:ISKra4 family transposase n=1 Tax=hydrothermal vent metagenome TaxID=652676 RepID=A0A3B0W9Z1_9ZZZZ